MEELQKLYKELEGRYEYLTTEHSNRRSPYMMARLDECRLQMVAVGKRLINLRFKKKD